MHAAIGAATFFVSAFFIFQVQASVSKPAATAAATKTILAILIELHAGMSILFRHRILVGTLLAIAVTMFGLGAVNVLLAPMIVNDLQVPETWFGLSNWRNRWP